MTRERRERINNIYEISYMVIFISLIWGMPWIFDISGTAYTVFYFVSAAGSSFGIISNWLLARRKVAGLYFQLTDMMTYAVISMFAGAYFEGGMNLILPLPITIYSIINWKKSMGDDNKVEPKELTKKQRNVYLPITIVIFTFAMFGLNIMIEYFVNGLDMNAWDYLFKFLDGAGGALTVVAVALMGMRAKEFSLVYSINNANAIFIWVFYILSSLSNGETPSPQAMISIATATGLAINGVYTHLMWKDAEKKMLEKGYDY